ncbi:MAG TPA: glycosyltransferase family A protein [Flavobacterium sp.]|nr:glycosyltransferase family A protein [Flavobacterium sp.]
MKTITVFTPTFNRAHLLPRLYKSLCRQTNQDFIWLVIDDGSSDNTKELVQEWIEENKIEIQYHYKENGGMHTGHNLAYANIETELNVCIDSDDFMPKDAIDRILKKWNSIPDKSKIGGIIGLDADKEGNIIGTGIPEDLKKGSLHDLYERHQVKGDKKLVLRTDIVKLYPPYPEFKGEKLVPLGILYLMMGRDYDFVYSNEIYCIVEYQIEGSSASILKQYSQSPRGFAYSRKVQISYLKDIRNQIKNYVHLISPIVLLICRGSY